MCQRKSQRKRDRQTDRQTDRQRKRDRKTEGERDYAYKSVLTLEYILYILINSTGFRV